MVRFSTLLNVSSFQVCLLLQIIILVSLCIIGQTMALSTTSSSYSTTSPPSSRTGTTTPSKHQLSFLSTHIPSSGSKNRSSRRSFLDIIATSSIANILGISTTPTASANAVESTTNDKLSTIPKLSTINNNLKETLQKEPFVYSNEWIGTNLRLMSLEDAISILENSKLKSNSVTTTTTTTSSTWDMGRWPDPMLRRPASNVNLSMVSSNTLQSGCQILQDTAQKEGAVGLAAQQCGIDARIIYIDTSNSNSNTGSTLLNSSDKTNNKKNKKNILTKNFQQRNNINNNNNNNNAKIENDDNDNIFLINPRIVNRSSELEMICWIEECLVLPPTIKTTLLRDAWIEVQYYSLSHQQYIQQRFIDPEIARCIQHEMDHDRGILTLDHISFEEMENDIMRTIEQIGHEERMIQAYSRQIEEPLVVV